MNELREILASHTIRYPRMQPTDAVKLIYQNEFGGGHLIRDEAQCLARLQQEYDAVPQSDILPLAEPIGNNMVRVHLAALDAHRCTAEQLCSAFIRSASAQQGNLQSFLEKLELLRQTAQSRQFSFTSEELEAYLRVYEQVGYPMVSHSEAYRAAYHPAYRIIRQEYLKSITGIE